MVGQADDKEYVSPTIFPPRSGSFFPGLGDCSSLKEPLLHSQQTVARQLALAPVRVSCAGWGRPRFPPGMGRKLTEEVNNKAL